MGKGVKISQATLTTPYKYSQLNILMAPIGSGKTYYFGGKFVEHISMPENKLVIFLAPLKAIVAQAHATERMEELTDESELLLKGFTIFTDEEPITPSTLTGKRIAMTAQKFIPLIKSHPEIIQQIGAVVLDEFDSILSNYAPQDRSRNATNGLHLLLPTLHNLSKIGIYTVLTSATMSNYAKKELSKYPHQFIKFTEPLSTLQPKSIQHFSSKSQILPSPLKTAVYMSRVSSLVELKTQLQSQGYKVALLKSKSRSKQAYEMNEYDLSVLSSIMHTGGVPDDLDFLLFNRAYERGISITKPQFDRVYVWDTNEIVQLQAAGRFRYDEIEWWFKGSVEVCVQQPGPVSSTNPGSNLGQLEQIDSWIGIELDSKQKKNFVKTMGWKNSNGSVAGWAKAKKELEKLGYVVKEERKSNKRLSIIFKS